MILRGEHGPHPEFGPHAEHEVAGEDAGRLVLLDAARHLLPGELADHVPEHPLLLGERHRGPIRGQGPLGEGHRGHRLAFRFQGTAEQGHGPRVPVGALRHRARVGAGSSLHLEGAVGRGHRGASRREAAEGRLQVVGLVARAAPGRLADEQAGRLQLGHRVGEEPLHRLAVGRGRPLGLVHGEPGGLLDRPLPDPHRGGGENEARSGGEPGRGGTGIVAAEKRGGVHPDVVEGDADRADAAQSDSGSQGALHPVGLRGHHEGAGAVRRVRDHEQELGVAASGHAVGGSREHESVPLGTGGHRGDHVARSVARLGENHRGHALPRGHRLEVTGPGGLGAVAGEGIGRGGVETDRGAAGGAPPGQALHGPDEHGPRVPRAPRLGGNGHPGEAVLGHGAPLVARDLAAGVDPLGGRGEPGHGQGMGGIEEGADGFGMGFQHGAILAGGRVRRSSRRTRGPTSGRAGRRGPSCGAADRAGTCRPPDPRGALP